MAASLPTSTSSSQPYEVTPAPFPAVSRTASATLAGVPTTATLTSFADKILITISQNSNLNHWLHVPLIGDSPLTDPSTYITPAAPSEAGAVDSSLLPFPHLTATTVLGGTKGEFEVLGQTLATTIASAVVMKQPDESRMIVFGLGLAKADIGRDDFEGLVGLCLEVL